MRFRIFFSIVALTAIWFAIRTSSRSNSAQSPAATISSPTPSSRLPATAVVPATSAPTMALSSSPSPASSSSSVAPLPQVSKNSRATNPQVAPIPQTSANTPIILKPRVIKLDATTNGILNGLISAIVSQESHGDYTLKHPVSGALGMGQVLPSNLPEWTAETFGREVSPEQFLANRDVQYYVIRQKLLQYYLQGIAASNGDLYLAIRRVAARWYSGQADLYESTKPVATGPSVQQYSYDILSRFQNFYPQNFTLKY
jgi:hypothetical protein